LPLRILLVGQGQDWIPEFCRQVMHLNFGLDQDINQPDILAAILDDLGQSSGDIIARANSDEIKSSLRKQTELAKEKGVFGAPTFFVGTEMFWGNDRLDDALVYASSQINCTSV
jgi:2-hydroxychromene-2-carboxylate isomerase